MTATDSTDHDAAIHNNNNNNNKEVRPASPLPEMPLLPITSPETIQACRNLTVTDRDIFVCSYPKSGTTWTQNLVVRLLAAHVNMELPLDWHLSHSAPFYEVNQYWDVVQGGRVPAKTPIQKSGSSSGKNDTYRVFNTHLRLHQLPPNAKCVYVMRDGMDVLVSFYHHLVHMNESDGGYTGSPEDFCKDFLNGTIAYGLWEDHIEAWLKETSTARTSSNNGGSILFLHYHEMRQNLKKEAARLSKFLGVADADMDRVLAAALPSCTFDAMKQERWRYTPQSVSWKADPQTGQPYDKFVRKGRVGDGKMFLRDVFTPTLFEKWTDNQKRAQRRWKAAGVDPSIIDLYLQRKVRSTLSDTTERRSNCGPSSHASFPSRSFLSVVLFFTILITNLVPFCDSAGTPCSQGHSFLRKANLDTKDVFVIVTSLDNSISVSVAKHLHPATIFWIILDSSTTSRNLDQKKKIYRILQRKTKQRTCHVAFFCPYGNSSRIRESAMECWNTMTQALSTTSDLEDDDNNSTSSVGLEYRLRGVLYNQYGYVDDRATLNSTDATDSVATTLAQYKLVSTAILIDALRDLAFHPASADLLKVVRPEETSSSVLIYDPEMRHIAVGTEAARGLPKMGIPAPIVENTYEGIHKVLTGSSTATSSWEVTYALVSALQVLYFKALASNEKHPRKVGNPSFLYDWYYGTVSPGMTQESLHVKMEIAKTVDEAGRLLAVALVGSQQQQEFDYPNGCFVGAQSGTGGPLCEQSALEGGKQLSDPEIQRLAYQVVQDLIEKY